MGWVCNCLCKVRNGLSSWCIYGAGKAHLDLQILDIVNLRMSIYHDCIGSPEVVSDNRVHTSFTLIPGLALHGEILIPLNMGFISRERRLLHAISSLADVFHRSRT